ALSRFQVRTGNSEVYEGIDALIRISSVIPLFWLFVPILWLSGKIGIGNRLYDWIAKHRLIFPIPGYYKIDR
ncbi:MAG TPA: DCC1-like thiol-disulfide oxidoreductase family protein, partial [Anaerovoracaceae bacterium]|nr:DCC1-like thiol-disulfide oxidoreductase family protein [Anaerovoracaceae bacterium]